MFEPDIKACNLPQSVQELQILNVTNTCDAIAFEQRDRTEPFDVEEVVQEMPREQRHDLWGRLETLLQDVLQDLPPEQWDRGGEQGVEVESAVDSVSSSNDACKMHVHIACSHFPEVITHPSVHTSARNTSRPL